VQINMFSLLVGDVKNEYLRASGESQRSSGREVWKRNEFGLPTDYLISFVAPRCDCSSTYLFPFLSNEIILRFVRKEGSRSLAFPECGRLA